MFGKVYIRIYLHKDIYRNTSIFHYRFAYTNAEPTVDAHKDIYDETISTIDGTTYTLLYHRPVNTGDVQDLELDYNKHFLFAHGTFSGGVLGQHYFSKATHVVSLACHGKY